MWRSGFAAVAPVVGSDPVGSLTGAHYPGSLIRPDRRMISPRIGISWRPIPASTIVIRAGYGIYPDTSVYQSIVLADGAAGAALKEPERAEQRGVPADARQRIHAMFVGHERDVWHRSELPHWLRAAVAVVGAARPAVCAADDGDLLGSRRARTGRRRFCPTAIRWARPIRVRAARRDSPMRPRAEIRSATPGKLQLRRRLRGGFAASLEYTYSKSIDDDAYLGGQGHTQRKRSTPVGESDDAVGAPSRRTGSIRGPSGRCPPSTSASCLSCRRSTPADRDWKAAHCWAAGGAER